MNKKIAMILGIVCLALTFAICVQIKTVESITEEEGIRINDNSELKDEVLRLRQIYNDEFAIGYNIIEKLGNVISYQPIDVDRVNKYYYELKALVERLEKETTSAIRKAEYTEKLIMFANAYRSQFGEIARSCAKAELYFFDARFDEAIEMVKDSLRKFIDISAFESKYSELEGAF